VNALLAGKPDRRDLAASNQSIDSLNDRVKHLSMVLNELAGALKHHGATMNDFNKESNGKM